MVEGEEGVATPRKEKYPPARIRKVRSQPGSRIRRRLLRHFVSLESCTELGLLT